MTDQRPAVLFVCVHNADPRRDPATVERLVAGIDAG
jgi:hypothetical protein